MVKSAAWDKKSKSKKLSNQTKPKNERDGATNNTEAAIRESFKFIDFFGKFLGWECNYDWQCWKGNPKQWFTTTLLCFTWSQLLYSQFKYFMNGEYGKVVEVCAVYGIAISCLLKYLWNLRYFKEVAAFHNFSAKIMRQAGGEISERLQDLRLQKNKISKFLCFLAFVSILGYIFNPVRSFINRDNEEMVPLLPIEIVFIDQSTVSGYLVAFSIMSIMGFFALFALAFNVFHFFTIIINYSVQVDLIEVDIRRLDELWSVTTTTSVSERHMFLRNICLKFQDMDNYMDEIKRIFDRLIFVVFSTAYISQIICLYEIETKNWISGYGIAYGLFSEMLVYCYFGTKAESINDRLFYVLTQSNWYTYDIHSQKIYLNLLCSCMNFKELWIGPVAPLSVISGIQIVKSVYSFYTFLTEAA